MNKDITGPGMWASFLAANGKYDGKMWRCGTKTVRINFRLKNNMRNCILRVSRILCALCLFFDSAKIRLVVCALLNINEKLVSSEKNIFFRIKKVTDKK